MKRFNPAAKIVLTLSPVPLQASATVAPVITASMVSKAALRVALDSVMARNLPDVFYWPSYECVLWYGTHVGKSFGDGQDPSDNDTDMRHVRRDVINLITSLFKSYYFIPQ